jgi:uncharacterized Zn-binding protein involved in type VI secretion
MKPAARVTDPVAHPLPPTLMPGPGSLNVLIQMLPAWRGVPAAVAAALQAAKQVANTAIQAAEAATAAAAGTPGAPAAKAAEEATKLAAGAAMSAAITSAAAGADIHACTTPLPTPPHGPGVVTDGSPTVLINGLPACRMGDTILEALGPPNKIVMGCPTVLIGDQGGGGSVVVPNAPGVAGGGGGPAGPGGGGEQPGGGGEQPGHIGGLPVTVLPNGDVKVGDSIIIKGDLEFQTKTLAALGQIAATPTGQALLESIDKSGKTVTIVKTEDGNACGGYPNPNDRFMKDDGTPGAGTDATVWFNPDRETIGTEEWETRPPAIGLAHELVHAEQATKGMQKTGTDDNDDRPDPTDPSKKEQEKKRELEAAGIPPYDQYPYNENKIRKEWHPPQPERKWY